MTTRFEDDNRWLYDFADLFLVHCPRCDHMAKVIIKDDKGKPEKANANYTRILYSERRLVCTNCAYVDEWQGKRIQFYMDKDWFFEQPLWLLMSCCGETLVAFNETHLNFLEKFVDAKLRRPAQNNTHTLANTLPKWIQLRENRADVHKCIAKLRATLPERKPTR